MPKKIYTDEMKEYLAEIVPGRRINEVTALMNQKFNTSFTETQMENLKTRLKLKNGLPTNIKGNGKITTDEQDDFIRKNYKGLFNKELTDLINKEFGTSFTIQQIMSYKSRHRLDSGIDGCFEKGHKPFNKGLKQKDYLSQESLENIKATQFKKGQKPTNWEPIGYERISKGGYIEVKVRDQKGVHSVNNFELKHRLLWEKHYGEIPEKHVILFKNGNPQDIRLDNLMMIHRKVVAQVNKQGLYSHYPELTEAGVNLIKLQFKTKELEELE